MIPVVQPRWVAAAVLALGLMAAVATAVWQNSRNESEAARRFGLLARQVADQVSSQLQTYEYGLRGARGAIVAGGLENADRRRFGHYAATREVEREFPGARGFGIIRRISPRDEAAFVEAARQDDWPDFSVRQLQPHDGDRYIIQYIEPVAPNRGAVGLDIASETERRLAAEASMRSGAATLTAPIALVQATGQSARGFLLLLPIFRPGAPVSTADERAAATFGWSYTPLIIDEVLQNLYPADAPYTLSLRDVDGRAARTFYDTAGSAVAPAGGLNQRMRIPMFGRTWEADVSTKPAFLRMLDQTDPRNAGLAVAAVAVLLSMLAYLLAHGALRTQAERLEKSRRSAIVEGSFDAIIGETMAGIVSDWNVGAERLFGYPASFAVGREVAGLLLPPGREAEHAEIRRAISRGERVAPSTRHGGTATARSSKSP